MSPHIEFSDVTMRELHITTKDARFHQISSIFK
jgi:hypothetical protein